MSIPPSPSQTHSIDPTARPPLGPTPMPQRLPTSLAPSTYIHVPARVDERCFTYCQQRAPSRITGNEPLCRTLCWRRVFKHEAALSSGQPVVIGSDMGSRTVVTRRVEEDMLPDNGPVDFLRGGSIRGTGQPRNSDKSNQPNPRPPPPFYPPPHDGTEKSTSPPIPPSPTQPQQPWYHPGSPDKWRFPFLEGRFVYYARGPLRAAERMDSMRDLGLGQGWVDEEPDHSKPVSLKELGAEPQQKEATWDPDFAILISLELIPPMVHEMVGAYFSRVLTPMSNLSNKFIESFKSGHQQRTMKALWEKAWDTEEGTVGTLRKWREAEERRRREKEKDERSANGSGTGNGKSAT